MPGIWDWVYSKTLTLETVTSSLESKDGLSLGQSYFVGIWQVSLLNLGHVFASWAASLCVCTWDWAKPKNPKPWKTLACPQESKHYVTRTAPLCWHPKVGLLDLDKVLTSWAASSMPCPIGWPNPKTLEILTWPLDTYNSLSLGRPNFVGILQVGLQDFSQVSSSWAASHCALPFGWVNPRNPSPKNPNTIPNPRNPY